MNKVIKLIITIVVTILIILYFLIFYGKMGKTNYCSDFEKILNTRIEQYFILNSPKTEGEIVSVSVNELIANGNLVINDLENVGTSCTGTAYASRIQDKLYYYNNISCGSCSIDKLYGSWSDWQETLPSFNLNNYQVMTKMLYNYGDSEVKWTDWSEWGEDKDKIKSPTLPVGAEMIDTEIISKMQYRYRAASYQWYMLSDNTEYYNGNNYYSETAPDGYERLDSSKTYSRTTKAYLTKEELRQKENIKAGDQELETNGYIIKTPKYIYSYTTPSTTIETNVCETYITKYRCYKKNRTTYESESVYTSADTAIAACNQVTGSTNCSTVSSTNTACPSGYSPSGSVCTKTYRGTQHRWFTTDKNVSADLCVLSIDTVKCSVHENSDRGSDSYFTSMTYLKYYWVDETTHQCGERKTCHLYYTCDSGGTITTTEPNKYIYCVDTKSPVTTTRYKYTYDIVTKIYDTSTYYETCPSGYPNRDTSQKKTECRKYKEEIIPGTTYYLKADGTTTTSKSSAAYLAETQYNALKNNNSSLSSYTKTGTPQYEYETSNYIEGNCPSGKVCDTTAMYKATIYKYKWFKKGIATKIWCNNGAYSEESPATGCMKDETTAKWTNWSEYSDTEVKKTDTNEVETKKLIKHRQSYIDSNDLVLADWLSYTEFEETTGKKIEDLRKDESVKLFEKVMYRYRIRNSK